MYRLVQLSFTPEIEVIYMVLEISLSIFSMTSLKQHMKYFDFRCKIQLDLPVRQVAYLLFLSPFCTPEFFTLPGGGGGGTGMFDDPGGGGGGGAGIFDLVGGGGGGTGIL